MATEHTQLENDLLRDLVACYSPSGREQVVAEILHARFCDWGWEAKIDEAGNVVGRLGRGSPTICFLGHIDTVAGEIPVRVEGNVLHGRGTVDAKGPLAAAACAAARLPRDINKTIVIVGAVGEESPGSPGANHIAGRLRPDFAIVGEPSRWDRITIGYKGILHFRYTLEQPRAHGAAELPSAATLATRFLAATISEAAGAEGEGSPFKAPTTNIRSINTESGEFADRVVATVDMRLPESVDPDERERQIREAAGDAAIEVIEKLPAVRCDKNNALVRAMLAAIREHGGKPRFVLKTGTSDMNVVAPVWKCPIVAYGPGDSSLDHTPDEHIDLDEYQRAIGVLTTLFLRL